ncbi:NAD-dependent epimerase/dehydratase family protein [Hoeflea poritis]|uniref:NAD(P)-dependent oxidoreductase n=1 Tax=Hoeflea poritis TaxID=2993659 RepID=A0ABT4VHG2_9HYPH|nr:NAD(P)-dependent oxidoreductase [Hoeflea poritis]MDA4844144.1 NAD(P)-dependent oxidoreductase [Hoeflea poritis]
MIVFVTGATGVLGRPVIHRLVQNGHQVRALCRSQSNLSVLQSAGAIPLDADLFDPVSLGSAVQDCDTILHLATRIPTASELKNQALWAENDRIRSDGMKNLIAAAENTGSVKAIVYPSISFFYGDAGADWISADSADCAPCGVLQSTLDAEAQVKSFADDRTDRRGIVLRFGAFYGPSSPDSVQVIEMARKGLAMSIAAAPSYKSMIWIDDAAAAVVEAAENAPSGTYDVVEDDPSTQHEAIDALAAAVGRKRLVRLPRFLLRLAVPPELRGILSRSQRISNARFREVTGWRPEVPSQREGWRRMVMAAETTK